MPTSAHINHAKEAITKPIFEIRFSKGKITKIIVNYYLSSSDTQVLVYADVFKVSRITNLYTIKQVPAPAPVPLET